jgi:Protein of unknown function (DUF1367)
MRLYLKKTLTGFDLNDEHSQQAHRKFKLGEVYRADVVKPRSYKHLCLAMSLLNLTYDHLPERYEGRWPTFDAFRYAVAEAAGHIDQYISLDGEIKRQARSVSYDAIPDDVKFGSVMAAMMTVCANILEMTEPDLASEVARYADAHYGR